MLIKIYIIPSLNSILSFLTLELPILSNNILPLALIVHNILDNLEDFFLCGADLCRAVSFTQGNRVVLDSLEVNGDTEGRSKFVITGIATANRLGRVVYFVGNSVCTKFVC